MNTEFIKKAIAFIQTLLKHCFTESDNLTFDLGRILWGIGGLIFFGISIYAVIFKGQSWDPIAWGTGFGGVLAGGGATIAIKSREK